MGTIFSPHAAIPKKKRKEKKERKKTVKKKKTTNEEKERKRLKENLSGHKTPFEVAKG